MKQVRVIAHTHRDKERYFTDNRSTVYSLYYFDEIIKFLEDNKDFPSFLLDGQTSIIENYLKFRPENKKRIIKLIKENRLITGPWFSQTDTLVISGESIIRNLLMGIKDSESLGGYQSIGYLPDSFGMSEQMPLIYKQFDLKYAFFRRGIADHILNDRQFLWKSPSGDEIKTFNLYHYGNMAYPPNESDNSYIENLVKTLEEFGNKEPFILFNGEDQKPIRKNIEEIIKSSEYDISISTLEKALDEVFDNMDNLKTYEGEFTFGQYSRTHKSIFSTRADLKCKNNFLENYLTEIIEPISAIASKLGIRYESEILILCRKLMLDNASHDSIGMCNSDLTNNFIEERFDKVYDLTKNLLDLISRRIGDGITKRKFHFQIYNTLPYERKDYTIIDILTAYKDFKILRDDKEIEFEILSIKEDETNLIKSIKEIGVNNELTTNLTKIDKLYNVKLMIYDKYPSMGYQTYNIKEGNSREIIKKSDKKFIENEFYKLWVDDLGHLIIENGSNINKIYIEDNGDEGDSYDYSHPSNDKYINEGKVEDIKIDSNKFYEELSFKLIRKVPNNLMDRENEIYNAELVSSITVRLYKGEKFIEYNYETINNIHEHRDRVIIDTKINTTKSIADEAFGTIIRDIDYKRFSNRKEDGWNERPRGIEPMMSFVALDNKDTVMATTDGVREYEILDDNKIAITMFRSIPRLGKPELNDRPGRASGVYEKAIGHELIGKKIKTTLYITDIENDFYKMHKFSKERLIKTFGYQAGEIKDNTDHFVISKNGDFPKNYSLLDVSGNVIFSTLKKSVYDDNLILRLYNPYRDIGSDFSIDYKDNINYIKADEQTPDLNDETISPCGIKTLKLS